MILTFSTILFGGIQSCSILYLDKNQQIGQLCISGLSTAMYVFAILYSYQLWIRKPYQNVLKLLSSQAEDKLSESNSKIRGTVFTELWDAYSLISNNTRKATKMAELIGNGDYDLSQIEVNQEDSLNKVLLEMRDKLQQVSIQEKQRSWLITGVSEFDQLLRENLHTDINEICFLLISRLVRYLDANQGGIYLINDFDPIDTFIELKGCYAFERRKFQTKRIEINEGLIGQSIREIDTIYLTDIPSDYIRITSGIGTAPPNCIVIVPIKLNQDVYGAIEIAAFEVFSPHKVELIQVVAENFASTYATLKSNLEMTKLLEASQETTQILQVKEEQLMQNEEKLQAAQNHLNIKLIELMAETNLTKSILSAINKSNACIQYDMNGNILDTNEMFLSVMGFSKEELVGKNERLFIPPDEIASERYQMLWESLRSGNFNAGEFRRMAKNGKEVWMDVTYNPIIDLQGKPFKIFMFAKFTTEEKEKENDYKNKFSIFNTGFGMIELHPDYSIKTANQFFLDALGMKRKDLKKYSFFDLVVENSEKEEQMEKLKIFTREDIYYENKITFGLPDGDHKAFLTKISAGKDLSGKKMGYFVALS